ncbi:MAG: hypothetical protein L0Z62_18050 [Gemmataceae bacterium]|nr:hypothetical protein [Gemmataceae bacterium]
MPLVQFADDQSFGRALSILIYEVRGTFAMQPDRKLVVGKEQFEALKAARLIDANGEPRRQEPRATKKHRQ